MDDTLLLALVTGDYRGAGEHVGDIVGVIVNGLWMQRGIIYAWPSDV